MATRRKWIMLTDEQRKLAEDNIRLAYWYAHQMKWTSLELEERISMALLGLVKAAEKYDPARGTSFATFARKAMHDEILMGFRKENKHANVISLNLPVGDDNHRGALEDVIPDNNNYIAEMESHLDAETVLGKLNNLYSGMKGKLYQEIVRNPGRPKRVYAEKLGYTPRYIQKVVHSMRKDARRELIC